MPADLGDVRAPPLLAYYCINPTGGRMLMLQAKSRHYNANSSDAKPAVAGYDKGAASHFHAIVNVFLTESATHTPSVQSTYIS